MQEVTVGSTRSFKGYVTILAAVRGKRPREIEQALGFSPGMLSDGYFIYELISPVTAADFEWKDRTKYSDGWHFDRSIEEYVQRSDQLRFQLWKRSGWDEKVSEVELRRFMEDQQRRLNVRVGSERIVKIVPRRRGTFPDSDVRNIPQWKLAVSKIFRCIAVVAPGAVSG
jgi:hypothetical protein